jgi:hypothetical protein
MNFGIEQKREGVGKIKNIREIYIIKPVCIYKLGSTNQTAG